MKTTTRNYLLIAFIILAAAIAFLVVPTSKLEVTSEAQHRFELDVGMARARKILVRTDAVKKMVAMADATLLDQKWQNMSFESDGPLLKADWHVSGKGQLSIEINDAYLGEQSIKLDQTVDVRPNRLYSTNKLVEPSKSIHEYDSTLELTPNADENGVVDTTLKITVHTTANLLTRSYVEKEIKAAAGRSLDQQEKAIRELIAEQRDKLLILPDFGRE